MNASRMKKDVRITAMRRSCYADLIERYENPIEHACDVCIRARVGTPY